MAIDITCNVKTYDTPQKAPIRVHSHWHDRTMVELEIVGVGERYTVVGKDLITAIENAMNTNEWG